MKTLNIGEFKDKQYFILCPWNLPVLNKGFSLMWSAVAFEVMERSTVEKYMTFVRELSEESIVLFTLMKRIEDDVYSKYEDAIDSEFLEKQLSDRFYLLNKEETSQREESLFKMGSTGQHKFLIYNKIK